MGSVPRGGVSDSGEDGNDDGSPDGYLATPEDDGADAVLLLHAWWGLNSTAKAYCDRLAEAGFVAFALDLYHGKIACNVAAAEAPGEALDADAARADVGDSARSLATRTGGGIAVIGFSLGAYYGLELALAEPDRPEHNGKAAETAWTRTLEFLHDSPSG